MKTHLLCVAAALCMFPAAVRAETWRPPAAGQRCPSKWGRDDERGAANHVKPGSVLRAARLIRTGEVIELGHVLSADMPLFSPRHFALYLKRSNPPAGANLRGSNEETVSGELGQVGTQLDMFPHQSIGDDTYNCHRVGDIATRTGFSKLGIDKVGALVARGVLVDVAAAQGVPTLAIGHEITPAELQAALKRERLALAAGDAVLIHTGWGKLWTTDPARYGSGAPGIGVAAAEWLAKQDVMLIGADTWPVEIAPNPDKALNLPVHQIALVVNGIFLLENLKLDELAARKVYEFAFVVQPLKLKGGTGSAVAPIAIR